jgi:hypothetical protein
MAAFAVFAAAGKIHSGETTLDHLPSAGKIVISLRERPHAMQVIGQYADRWDLEGISALGFNPGMTKTAPRKIGGQEPAPVEGDDGEEERSAWNVGAAVLGHRGSVYETGAVWFGGASPTLREFSPGKFGQA